MYPGLTVFSYRFYSFLSYSYTNGKVTSLVSTAPYGATMLYSAPSNWLPTGSSSTFTSCVNLDPLMDNVEVRVPTFCALYSSPWSWAYWTRRSKVKSYPSSFSQNSDTMVLVVGSNPSTRNFIFPNSSEPLSQRYSASFNLDKIDVLF